MAVKKPGGPLELERKSKKKKVWEPTKIKSVKRGKKTARDRTVVIIQQKTNLTNK